MLFTYHDYCAMLRALRERGYIFASFPEARDLLAQQRPFVLMRHDIDMDLHKALRLAELEADFGVAATYFFLVRTEHYNIFSRLGAQIVARILELGHHFGLHFDCGAYSPGSDLQYLSASCGREVHMLEAWFGRPIAIVSIHRPNQIALSGEPGLTAPLPHTYMPVFTRDIRYFSDSRGRWRFGEPVQSDAFQAGRPLHILTHPIWWNEQPVAAYDALVDFVVRRTEGLKQSIARHCTVYRVGRTYIERGHR